MTEQQNGKKRKEYANQLASLQLLWETLQRCASPEKPLSVGEIHAAMPQDKAPSKPFLEKLFNQENLWALDTFPDRLVCVVKRAPDDEGPSSWLPWQAWLEIAREANERLSPQAAACVLAGRGAAPGKAPLPKGCPCPRGMTQREWTQYWGLLLTKGFQWQQIHQDETDPTELERELEQVLPVRWRYYYLESALTYAQWRYLDLFSKSAGLANSWARPHPTSGSWAQKPWSQQQAEAAQTAEEDQKRIQEVVRHLRPPYSPDPPLPDQRILDLLQKAIDDQRWVELCYGSMQLGLDSVSRCRPFLQYRHPDKPWDTYAPLRVLFENGGFYLVCCKRGENSLRSLRLDRIMDLREIPKSKQPKGWPQNQVDVTYRQQNPLMYSSRPLTVKLRCRSSILNQVVDQLGSAAAIYRQEGDAFTVTASLSYNGARAFALQYADRCQVVEPPELRDEVRALLRQALDQYDN